MVKTENKIVSEESSRRELMSSVPPFSPQPSIPNWSIDDIRNALFLSCVQIVTFPQGTPIPDSDLSLKYGLTAELETTRDGIMLRSGDLDEDAFGLTYEEAYLDFLTSLRDRYYSLCTREASLSRRDQSILQRLRHLLVPS